MEENEKIEPIVKPEPIIKPEDRTTTIPAPSEPLTVAEAPKKVEPYNDLFKAFYPEPSTEEQMAAEDKKHKRDQTFAAISDGISALANLHFATKGASNMYTGKNTLSEKYKVTYDKLLADRKENQSAYYNAQIKAKAADDAAKKDKQSQANVDRTQANTDRAFDYKKEQDALNRKVAAEKTKAAAEQQAIENTLADRAQAHKEKNDATSNQIARERNNLTDASNAAEDKSGSSKSADQLKFAIGNGNEFSIDKNVWSNSWQQVYDVMLPELEVMAKNKNIAKISDLSLAEKEALVKQHWQRSAKGKQKMYEMAREETPGSGKTSYDVPDNTTGSTSTARPTWDPNK